MCANLALPSSDPSQEFRQQRPGQNELMFADLFAACRQIMFGFPLHHIFTQAGHSIWYDVRAVPLPHGATRWVRCDLSSPC